MYLPMQAPITQHNATLAYGALRPPDSKASALSAKTHLDVGQVTLHPIERQPWAWKG